MFHKKFPPDPPRYLLPAGCKDLGDVLKAARQETTSPSGAQPHATRILKRVMPLCLLAEHLEACLQAAEDTAPGSGLFFVELSPEDFLGVWPDNLVICLHRPEWRADLEEVRRVAAEQGLTLRREVSVDGTDAQVHYVAATGDAGALARATSAVLEDGFRLPSDLPINFLTSES